ncbi:MAG: phosphate ABC transporter permease PstA [Myxococcota bacterium]
MTEPKAPNAEAVRRRLRQRYAAERRFRVYGAAAIGAAMLALVVLLLSVVVRAVPAFWEYDVRLPVRYEAAHLDPEGRGVRALPQGNYAAPVREALRARFPEVSARSDIRALNALLSVDAPFELRERVLAEPSLVGRSQEVRLLLSDAADLYLKSRGEANPPDTAGLSAAQVGWLDALQAEGRIERVFATRFFRSGDSREPELAGVWGAVVGSFWTLVVTLVLSFPIGTATALYLEEFAPRSRWTDWIEVNINNLAAVPSIVFGLLGLALFLNLFGLPRSAPLVGGMVLALMTLPTVVIAGRSAIRAVPPSVREAALAVGASPLQVALQHVLPLALPGVLTGTIIGMARALGETAPLLMIGMVAFIVDVPSGVMDPASVLPVQIFLWADAPERAFLAKTSAAILVLLGFLVTMNLSAVLLRSRFERRW